MENHAGFSIAPCVFLRSKIFEQIETGGHELLQFIRTEFSLCQYGQPVQVGAHLLGVVLVFFDEAGQLFGQLGRGVDEQLVFATRLC